jgi:hypothetical protein
MRELGNRPAGDGKRAQNAKMLFRRNERKDLLKPKELSIFRGEKQSEFSGAKSPHQSQEYGEKSTTGGAFPCLARPSMTSQVLDA